MIAIIDVSFRSGAHVVSSSVDETFTRALGALQAGMVDDAERFFKKTLERQPRHVPALNLYSILLTRCRRFEEAERFIKRAIKENATSDASFYNYGVILKALKRYDEAIAQFDRALALNGSVPDTLNARGDVLLELGRSEEAVADFDRALSIDPRFADALVSKARALPQGEARAALGFAERALALQPNHALAWLVRGNLLNEQKRHDEALASFARSLSLQADLAEAWLGRGDALRDLRQIDEAVVAYEKALAIKPDLASAYNALGLVSLENGQTEDAQRTFRKSIEIDPTAGGFYLNLAATKKFSADDPDLAAMEAFAAGATGTSKDDRALLDFALGKAYADIGDHRRSFQHFLAANSAHRSTVKYDESETFSILDGIEKVFTRELIAAKAGAGDPSSRPIFIIGMPRSGSTLIEQILASHPAISGAGEVSAFVDALDDVLNSRPPARDLPLYPEVVPALPSSAIGSIGNKYIARLAALAPEKERATDKMLANFLYAGLIHLALPNAVILHTARDPLFSCVSSFSLKFKDSHYYTYDLAELGRYYKRYRRLMQHWHNVLPPSRILDVQYEDVVADLEGQARRIVAHCGLPWDDRCLSFHKTERTVRTASHTQVRQPIYKSSVSRWRAYEEFLGPLLKELGPEASAASSASQQGCDGEKT